jgi:response regulator of citrate/malate metabolism
MGVNMESPVVRNYNLKDENFAKQANLYNNKLNILIVEDDPFSQKLLSHYINMIYKDHKIIIAADFEQAKKDIFNSDSIKFAIIDIYLEGPLTGIDLLNTMNREGIDIPIVMTSSVSREKFYEMLGKQKREIVYLRKPYDPEGLRYILEHLKKLWGPK